MQHATRHVAKYMISLVITAINKMVMTIIYINFFTNSSSLTRRNKNYHIMQNKKTTLIQDIMRVRS